ncbi:MAG: dienelactone hydrolase family protein [Planctomycetes bacterium]|nr:dienelactone hydrolase family protein [Planctomycetota bacterium]
MTMRIAGSLVLFAAFCYSQVAGQHKTIFRCNQCPEGPEVRAVVFVAGGEQADVKKALDDPAIVHKAVTFKNGDAEIKGYLVRPRKEGPYPGVIIVHGNPGATDDVRDTACQLAQAGFVGLLVDWGSRAPMPESKAERAKWVNRITGYTFQKLVLDDIRVAVEYLKSQPFVQPGGIGMVGFCGGGKQALMFSTRSKDVNAVVAFYASANFR